MVQHHRDDDWFHAQPEFVRLSTLFAVQLRTLLEPGLGHQAGFVGHISVELLLDAILIERQPQLLQRYYQLLDQLDPGRVQAAANRILRQPEERLTILLPRFSQERFLADYVDDAGLLLRLGGVMRRVGLPPLPDLTDWLADARQQVCASADQLLPTEPTSDNYPSHFAVRIDRSAAVTLSLRGPREADHERMKTGKLRG